VPGESVNSTRWRCPFQSSGKVGLKRPLGDKLATGASDGSDK
jgi:hypothetical protein